MHLRGTEAAIHCFGVLVDVRNAFVEILANAIYFAPTPAFGGRIDITVEKHEEHVSILFWNNGAPIPNELLQVNHAGVVRLFEWFEAGHADRTGMGLAYAKWAFENCKGSIAVEAVEAGACFRVELPLSKAVCE